MSMAPPRINASMIENRLQNLEKTNCEHDEFINGNGHEGAKTTLARMDDRLKIIEDRLAKIEALLDRVLWGIILTIAVGVIVWLLTWLLPRIIALPGIINP